MYRLDCVQRASGTPLEYNIIHNIYVTHAIVFDFTKFYYQTVFVFIISSGTAFYRLLCRIRYFVMC